jgi:hypothetical protein
LRCVKPPVSFLCEIDGPEPPNWVNAEDVPATDAAPPWT